MCYDAAARSSRVPVTALTPIRDDRESSWRSPAEWQANSRQANTVPGVPQAPSHRRDRHERFILATHWLVEGSIEEVAAILAEPERLPDWWPEVYLDVRVLDPGDADGIGRSVALTPAAGCPTPCAGRPSSSRRTARTAGRSPPPATSSAAGVWRSSSAARSPRRPTTGASRSRSRCSCRSPRCSAASMPPTTAGRWPAGWRACARARPPPRRASGVSRASLAARRSHSRGDRPAAGRRPPARRYQ